MIRRRIAVLLAAAAAGGMLTASPAQAEQYGDTEFKSVTINDGKPIVVGTSATVAIKITAQIYDDSGIDGGVIDGMLGIARAPGDGLTSVYLDGPANHNMSCVKTTATVSTCTGTATIHPTR